MIKGLKITLGVMGGIIIAMGSSLISDLPSSSDTARVYKYENDLKIIRTREAKRRDNLYIQKSKDSDKYTSIELYLNNIEDEHDREVERANIEKIVGRW